MRRMGNWGLWEWLPVGHLAEVIEEIAVIPCAAIPEAYVDASVAIAEKDLRRARPALWLFRSCADVEPTIRVGRGHQAAPYSERVAISSRSKSVIETHPKATPAAFMGKELRAAPMLLKVPSSSALPQRSMMP